MGDMAGGDWGEVGVDGDIDTISLGGASSGRRKRTIEVWVRLELDRGRLGLELLAREALGGVVDGDDVKVSSSSASVTVG